MVARRSFAPLGAARIVLSRCRVVALLRVAPFSAAGIVARRAARGQIRGVRARRCVPHRSGCRRNFVRISARFWESGARRCHDRARNAAL
ncbi:hypothetical protein AB3662_20745 [Sorangium cellulosum]|uniref:hypothetical protein n=1 Tax=Sorangium cellulosum TaxID=56 RepID=UPI003D9A0FB5